jgi:hypothetical protein
MRRREFIAGLPGAAAWPGRRGRGNARYARRVQFRGRGELSEDALRHHPIIRLSGADRLGGHHQRLRSQPRPDAPCLPC